MRDEAEIRGHRRTYIGAMPGKLLHAMKRAEAVDPVLLLDEIDKMSADFRGDPAAALLEVLDPEQNHQFQDHYLDLDYDLSKVTFVCTANSLQGIPLPLQDRLEIIELSGYTEQEKVAIARKYLLPRQMRLNGITDENLEISNRALLDHGAGLHEGIRSPRPGASDGPHLPQGGSAGGLPRHSDTRIKVVTSNLTKLLGPPSFSRRQAERRKTRSALSKGLAVSPWGGELLNIEVATVRRARASSSLTGSPRRLAQGIRQRGLHLLFGREPRRWAWSLTFTSPRISTSTTQATRFVPMAPRPASPWGPRRW